MNFGVLGAILGLLGVLAGAFGAHALRTVLPIDLVQVFETGVRYQMFHALALILVHLVERQAPGHATRAAGWLFVAGIVLFSGSLYALAISGVRLLGAITPLGGLCLLAGWASLAIALKRGR